VRAIGLGPRGRVRQQPLPIVDLEATLGAGLESAQKPEKYPLFSALSGHVEAPDRTARLQAFGAQTRKCATPPLWGLGPTAMFRFGVGCTGMDAPGVIRVPLSKLDFFGFVPIPA
jgi:hypothetical protein